MPGLLLKKTSTPKTSDIEYLDETSDKKMKYKALSNDMSIEEIEKQNETILRSVSYLTKEEFGAVYAAGYLRDRLLSHNGSAPEKWGNQRRKDAIELELEKIIKTHGSYRKGVGHALMLSIAPELQDRLESAGLNVDKIMAKEMKKVMGEFQKEFYPGDRIGYAWGVHHDTDNRHIHIFLSNRTEKGAHVAFSNPLKGKRSPRKQLDQIGYVKKRFELAEGRVLRLVEKAEKDLDKVPLQYLTVSRKTQEENLREMRKPAIKLLRGADALALKRAGDRVESLRREYEARSQMVRRIYAKNQVRQESIARGYENVKDVRNELSDLYRSLDKANARVYPRQVLRRLFPTRGPVAAFSRLVDRFNASTKRAEKERIIRAIQTRKQTRETLQKQIDMVKEVKLEADRQVAFAKIQRDKVAKEYFQHLRQFRRDSDRREISEYLNTTSSREMRNRYFEALRAIKRKENISVQREFLTELAKTARRANADAAERADIRRLQRSIADQQSAISHSMKQSKRIRI